MRYTPLLSTKDCHKSWCFQTVAALIESHHGNFRKIFVAQAIILIDAAWVRQRGSAARYYYLKVAISQRPTYSIVQVMPHPAPVAFHCAQLV